MSVLRKRGKEKLRFRIMNRKVTNKEFKYLKRLFLNCLKENSDIEKQLDSYYRLIQVFFFYEKTDPNVEKSIRDFLKDPEYPYHPKSIPAFATSRKGFGCIAYFSKHLMEFTENREDLENVEAYHKNGVFEELCHLVEQKGDSGIHPRSYGVLWTLYQIANRLKLGDEIISRLDTDRNHYEVYLMMVKAYPKEWVARYWKYFKTDPIAYEQEYEKWKKNTPIEIVYGRLITDTLRAIITLCVAKRVPKEKLLNKQKKLLDILIEKAKLDIEAKKRLIERDMGFGALSLIDSLDESIFKTSDVFFAVILDLWKSLRLI
jgi:hypothetical protein